ncbi:MAG: NAD(P)H-dependent oxidoreductase [Steroidobacteraceae bacterium]
MRILIIDGHPDARPGRFIHALADAYRNGAEAAGHEIRRLDIGALDFPILRTAEDFQKGRTFSPSAASDPSGRM